MQLIEQIPDWAASRPDVEAVLLVGSWARGAARPDSDVDLVVLTARPEAYLENNAWLSDFGQVVNTENEDWGMVQSRRVIYAHGLEVEFGITLPAWASLHPVDAGTAGVVRAGARILLDRRGRLGALLAAV